MSSELSALELQLLLAIMRRQPTAYGVSIGEELKQRINKDLAFGTIYASLERLGEKGFVTRQEGEASPERGGRRKTYFFLTAPGQIAAQAALNDFDLMRKGVRWTEGPAIGMTSTESLSNAG